jgi:hypothetical protein
MFAVRWKRSLGQPFGFDATPAGFAPGLRQCARESRSGSCFAVGSIKDATNEKEKRRTKTRNSQGAFGRSRDIALQETLQARRVLKNNFV